jgi:AmmeMemoRadiSam system protein A
MAEIPGQPLLDIARRSIAHGLQHGQPLPIAADEFPAPLREQRATFVTLTKNRQLRGCIGTTEAVDPLVVSVAKNAYASAFSDPRFPPLAAEEFPHIHISVSLLTPPAELPFSSEHDLINQLRPGIDGLIIAQGRYRATFLPSVWESLPEPADFLAQLKKKASIPPSLPVALAWRYTAETLEEEYESQVGSPPASAR